MLPLLDIDEREGAPMAITVKSKPNHYEVLGVEATASDEEIARAFAREMSPFRPRGIGGLAQLSLAFETLRDPARRRAYDASLGAKPEPEPEVVPVRWSMPRRAGWPFMAAQAALPERPAEAPVEPPKAPFVAAPPPKPTGAESAPAPRPQPEPARRAEAPATPGLSEEPFAEPEDDSGEWKRPVLIMGGLFVGVAFLGAWLGVEAGNDAEAGQPAQAVTRAFEEAKAAPPAADPPPETPDAAEPRLAEARPEPRTRAADASSRAERAPRPRPRPAEQRQAQAAQEKQSRIEDIASSLAVEEAPAVAATPAKLPLPDSVVARTIGRIGYSCGEVASTTAVEGGASGVFKVTCTSGDSYRAAPVRGRYHFRRWGRQ